MKILILHLNTLRHNEHYQFQSGFKQLILLFTAVFLKIEVLFNAFLLVLAQEEEAMNVDRKSDVADDIVAADDLRDNTFRGMCDLVQSAAKHFRLEVRQAAARIQKTMDFYGNVAILPYNEQTSNTNDLIRDLQTKHAADMVLVGMTEWVTELKVNNDAFEDLKNTRYTEDAVRTKLQMKIVRRDVDAAYKALTERISALMVVNGEADYTEFVNELNARIVSNNNIIAIRKGVAEAQTPPPAPTV